MSKSNVLKLSLLIILCVAIGSVVFVREKESPNLLAKRFYERLRNDTSFTTSEIDDFFSFPLNYKGFELKENSPACDPPEFTMLLNNAGELLTYLRHFRLEAGNADVFEVNSHTFATQEIGDCAHNTSITISERQGKIIKLELSTDVVY